MDWIERVYKPSERTISKQDWSAIRMSIRARDGYKCCRCGETKQNRLTLHHIIPRKEGGTNNDGNLMTLCRKCHDLIEPEGLRTYRDIAGFKREKQPDSAPVPVGNDWRSWVYGGCKRPD